MQYLAEFSNGKIFILYRVPDGKSRFFAQKLNRDTGKWEENDDAVKAFLFGDDSSPCTDEQAAAFEKKVMLELGK